MRPFLREYRQEIIVLILVLLAGAGLFAFSRYEGSLADLPSVLAEQVSAANQSLMSQIRQTLDSIGLMTLGVLAAGLLLLVYITWRVRYHWRHNEGIRATNCPRCGADIYRVHRSAFDRILSATLLPSARRYRCSNRECNWSGLRRRRHHEHVHKQSESA